MKKLLFTLLFALFLSGAHRASAEVSLSFFYDSLEEDGDWFEADDYGYCWQPRGVSDDWSPYTDGYWTYTDAGWTWVSYETFGWATYHYGRWADLRGRGWVWIPGYEWGPAWVSWRSNDDYVGWAPLPPRAVFRPGITISTWVDSYYDIGPSYYNFTSCRRFGSPSIRQVLVDRSENVTIINQTTNITNITYENNVVFNGGPNYDRMNRRSDRQIERLKLERVSRFDDQRDQRFSRKNQGHLAVVAPVVIPVEGGLRPRNVKANLGKVSNDTGWGSVRDEKIAQQTRQKIRAENKGKVPESVQASRQESVSQALRSEARMKAVKAGQIPAQALRKPKEYSQGKARPVDDATPPPAKVVDPSHKPPTNPSQNVGPRHRPPVPTGPLKLTDPAPQEPMGNRPNVGDGVQDVPARSNVVKPSPKLRQPATQAPVDKPQTNNQELIRQRAAAARRQEAARQENVGQKQQEQQQINRQRAQAAEAQQQRAIRQQAARQSQQAELQQNQERAQRQAAMQQQQQQQQRQMQNRQQQEQQQQVRPAQNGGRRSAPVEAPTEDPKSKKKKKDDNE